ASPVLIRLFTDDSAQDIRLAAVRALAAHPRPEVPGLLMKAWRTYTPAVRREVTEAMLRQPDRIRFFLKEVEAGRVKPGDLDSLTKTAAALLVDILNPNQAIDNNYINYLITTKSGKSLTGIISAETASSLSLKRAEGQTETVLRADIDEIVSSGVSLMPEGLE